MEYRGASGFPTNKLPTHGDAASLFAQAITLHQAGRLGEAKNLYEKLLTIDNKHVGALSNLGTMLSHGGHYEEGIRLIRRSLEINPDQPVALNNLGAAAQALNRPDEALASYERAIVLKPDYAEAHNNRASVLLSLNRLNEALASCDRALALRPDSAAVHSKRGEALQRLNRLDEALESYDRALSLRPDLAEAHYNRGRTLQSLKRLDEAVASYDRALALRDDFAEAHNNRGNTLKNLGQWADALASYDCALAIKPDSAEAYSNRGHALQRLNRLDESLASFDRALALKPDYAKAYYLRGRTLQYLNRMDLALASYERAIGLALDLPSLHSAWLYCKMCCCSWEGLDAGLRNVVNAIDLGKSVSYPFAILALPLTPAQLQRCARNCIQDMYVTRPVPVWRGERYHHDRVRIGYFSSDFSDHPVSQLISRLIESHDRNKFEVIGFTLGSPADDAWRRRLEKAFDRFIDVENTPDAEIATLARENELDIAVDLNGFTGNDRPLVFARRAAPVQVNYLGYPGTLGAEYMDYIIADSTVIPPEHQAFYDEKIVYLPHSFQANDSTKEISNRPFSRAELGLPDGAFVFCSFNNSFKITPDLFDIWMRLLHAVQNSVLWLSGTNPTAAGNLVQEAVKRGVSPERLIFAPRMQSLADHLGRHRQADLFLDTFYFNAHTNASNALWAGLPVLTRLGESFAGRVGASLLNAVGLPELITHSHAEYEALALELATQPERLTAIRRKLELNRTTHPLFNTAHFTKDIETAYLKMYDKHLDGLAPGHIVVDG